MLLGQVREMEVHADGPGYSFGAIQRPAADQRRDVIVRLWARLAQARAARVLAAGDQHLLAQLLDVIEQLLAVALADDLDEDLAQHAHIPAHRGGHAPAGELRSGAFLDTRPA